MTPKIRTLVVDDEFNARSNLKMMLEEFCPEIEVVGIAESADKAKALVDETKPELVFLDIKMPGEDGFMFLSSLAKRDFDVVFTTAHNQFALKAFKANAIDYLEKPIDIEELRNSVAKVVKSKSVAKPQPVGDVAANEDDVQEVPTNSIQRMLDSLVTSGTPGSIAIPTSDGFVVARNEEIIFLEADENYTTIYLTNKRKYLSCGSIKRFEDILDKRLFFRTHRSFIVNIAHHLKEFSRKEGNILFLSDEFQVPVARRILPDFLSRMNTI